MICKYKELKCYQNYTRRPESMQKATAKAKHTKLLSLLWQPDIPPLSFSISAVSGRTRMGLLLCVINAVVLSPQGNPTLLAQPLLSNGQMIGETHTELVTDTLI